MLRLGFNYKAKMAADKSESMKILLPFRIMLRLYSVTVLLWDILYIVVFSVSSILRAGWEWIKPTPLKPVNGEIVMVVGSSRGVGREIVQQMAMKGSKVISVDINTVQNEKTVSEVQARLPSGSKRVWNYTCDVTKQEDVAKMAQNIKNEVGNVTMLFHCCGIPSPRSLLTELPSDIYKTMDVTLMSHFWLLEAFLPSMKENNHGHVVALSSVAGLSGQADHLPLSVSQFAVQGLAESLMEDLRINKNNNIHVTLVHIYPFIISADLASDIRLRIPSYFGTIGAAEAAKSIIDAVRRNYVEVSIPKYLLFISHLLRILPRDATNKIRELLDTGIDF